MRELLGWKLSLGRVRGVQVSLHLFFLLFAAFWLYSFWRLGHDGVVADGLMWHGVVGLSLLSLSVLLHEAAHAWASLSVGGECAEILLVPWGGLAPVELPRTRDDHTAAQQELIVSLAGPLVNFLLCIITAPLLMALKVPLGELFNPLAPPLVSHDPSQQGAAVFVLALTFWINWVLFIFNLIPSFPMDGGRILRAVFWKWMGLRSAVMWTSIIGQSAAVILFITGLMLPDGSATDGLMGYGFARIPLVLLSVFVFFSARSEVQRLQEPQEDDSFMGYDFSQGYTSLERTTKSSSAEPKASLLQQWLDRRRAAKQAKQKQIEMEEEARLDEVLCRLHEVGREGLSAADRRLLDRVSARYRSRLQQ